MRTRRRTQSKNLSSMYKSPPRNPREVLRLRHAPAKIAGKNNTARDSTQDDVVFTDVAPASSARHLCFTPSSRTLPRCERLGEGSAFAVADTRSPHNHAVAPLRLRVIQRLIGRAQQRLAPTLLRKARHADRQRNRIQRAPPKLTDGVLRFFANLFRAHPRIFERRFRQNHREFLPAVTARNVAAAKLRPENAPQRFQNRISRLVPKRIVESLEMVHIDHHHSQRTLLANRALQFAIQRLLHITPVV